MLLTDPLSFQIIIALLEVYILLVVCGVQVVKLETCLEYTEFLTCFVRIGRFSTDRRNKKKKLENLCFLGLQLI